MTTHVASEAVDRMHLAVFCWVATFASVALVVGLTFVSLAAAVATAGALFGTCGMVIVCYLIVRRFPDAH